MKNRLTAFLALSGFMGMAAAAHADVLIWECAATQGEAIQVFAQQPVRADRFGALIFQERQALDVRVAAGSPERFLVLHQWRGTVTKHAIMAKYLLVSENDPSRILALQLMGIDEFRDQRRRCVWD